MIRVAILLGPPGSGKGTQAARLGPASSLPHVATGDLFRQDLGRGTPLGLEAKGYMDVGKLVPDELVLEMLFERVDQADCRCGYMLDGFPRTLNQAESLDARLPAEARVRVANLEVPANVIVERAAGRLLCKECDRIHHREFAPPQVEGQCDGCSGELYRRKDDEPEVVRERLEVYEDQTRPLVDFYREREILEDIDGNCERDEVYISLENWLERVF